MMADWASLAASGLVSPFSVSFTPADASALSVSMIILAAVSVLQLMPPPPPGQAYNSCSSWVPEKKKKDRSRGGVGGWVGGR